MSITTEPPTRKRNYRVFTVRALLAATTVVAVLVALWMAFQPKKYVTAFLQVQNRPPGSILAPTKFDLDEMRAFREKQIELLRSDAVLGGSLKQPGIAQLSMVQAKSDPVAWLRAHLETQYVKDSEILRVQLASRHPEEAVKLVNAVVQVYLHDCVYADARNRKLHRDELQRIYEDRMLEARKRRKELIELATSAGNAKQTADKPGEKDAELARREALADKAFLQWEQAKLEAEAPSRVMLLEDAQIPEG